MSDNRFVLLCLALFALPTLASAQALPDPTQRTSMHRATSAAPAPTRWVLQSTLVAEDRRVAVINGRTVAVGGTVDGARVTDIQPYVVRLRTADGTLEITMTGADPKRATGGGS